MGLFRSSRVICCALWGLMVLGGCASIPDSSYRIPAQGQTQAQLLSEDESLEWTRKMPQPIQDLLYAEQKLLSRSLDSSKIVSLNNTQNKNFAPESGRVFRVKSYWIPESELHAFESKNTNVELTTLFKKSDSRGTFYRLLVHPESETFYARLVMNAETAEDLLATSTASSRTLLMWTEETSPKYFFGKLSLDKEVGGVVRTIPSGEVARSIGVTDILAESFKELPTSFTSLPESIGLMPQDWERGGMIIREIPLNELSGGTRWVPLFSLYAEPQSGTEILVEKMAREAGQDPKTYIRTRIIRPFVDQWIELAMNGISTEPHAQNVLIELDASGQPSGRFVHRDFGGFNVDLEYRAQKKLPTPTYLPVIKDIKSDYHQAHHISSLNQSLYTYFQGGFVFNLDKQKSLKVGDRRSYQKILEDEVLSSAQSYGLNSSHKFSLDEVASQRNTWAAEWFATGRSSKSNSCATSFNQLIHSLR